LWGEKSKEKGKGQRGKRGGTRHCVRLLASRPAVERDLRGGGGTPKYKKGMYVFDRGHRETGRASPTEKSGLHRGAETKSMSEALRTSPEGRDPREEAEKKKRGTKGQCTEKH